MRRSVRILFLIPAMAGAAMLAGCVERRYVITSDPPGAVVFRNGQALGATPVDDHFIYYGKYDFTLVKDGFETMQAEQKIPAPWYEWFPLDFFSENFVPWRIKDVRRLHFTMEPHRIVNTNELLQDAQNLRNRGMTLGESESKAPAPVLLPPPQVAPAVPH